MLTVISAKSEFVEAHVSRFCSDSVAGVGVVSSSRCFHIFDVSVSDLLGLFSPIFFTGKNVTGIKVMHVLSHSLLLQFSCPRPLYPLLLSGDENWKRKEAK